MIAAVVLVFVVRAAFSADADTTPSAPDTAQWARCEREESVEVIRKAWHECGTQESVRSIACREFRDRLAGLDRPTPEQHRALAIGYATAAIFEPDEMRREEMHRQSMTIMRGLVRDHPDDARWTFTLGLMEEGREQQIALLERTLEIDPACISAAEVLAQVLRDGAGDSQPDRAKARDYMLYAYQHATGRNKLSYARDYMGYIESSYEKAMQALELHGTMVADKRAFRAQVIRDLALDALPFDEANRAHSLGLVCNGPALEIGIEAICLQAMAMLVDRDRQAARPLGDDVLSAIELLATKILNHSPLSHTGRLIDQAFGAGARYVMYMRDVLDAEPEQHRSVRYYEAYASMTSMEHRIGVLRRALELDPGNGRVGFNLAESYMELELYGEAEEAYRHVVVHDDRRIQHDSGVPYSTMADEKLDRLRSMLTGGDE